MELNLLRDIMYAADWLQVEQKVERLKQIASPQLRHYFEENYEPVIKVSMLEFSFDPIPQQLNLRAGGGH